MVGLDGACRSVALCGVVCLLASQSWRDIAALAFEEGWSCGVDDVD